MAQIGTHSVKVIPQQLADRNVLAEVKIRPDLELHWLDALGQFASMLRLQHGMKQFIEISAENGVINSAGELVVTAGVHNETLQIAFPAGTWNWKKTENYTGGKHDESGHC